MDIDKIEEKIKTLKDLKAFLREEFPDAPAYNNYPEDDYGELVRFIGRRFDQKGLRYLLNYIQAIHKNFI